ncbi:RING-H2 finger protein ATL16-like [Canna indica]|uniref:RING-type E3 ubiquitin transferase n=1 Tax=Canna indica TaxID=4628 RepID=A0AAQ3Q600_9LILI|nr:RING-H2 finger protein ATL16-like [Canna indica]
MDATLVHLATKQPPAPTYSSLPILLAVAIVGMLVLLVGYFVFVTRCRRRPFSLSSGQPATTAQFRGLDPGAIRSIPVVKFDVEAETAAFCAVCLSEFREEERLKLLPSCAHAFHVDCIDTWLQFNTNCPLCRSEVSAAAAADRFVVVLAPRRDRSGETSRAEAAPATTWKKKRHHRKEGSMGDECIGVAREKEEQFCVEPIRRSFSMNSSSARNDQ